MTTARTPQPTAASHTSETIRTLAMCHPRHHVQRGQTRGELRPQLFGFGRAPNVAPDGLNEGQNLFNGFDMGGGIKVDRNMEAGEISLEPLVGAVGQHQIGPQSHQKFPTGRKPSGAGQRGQNGGRFSIGHRDQSRFGAQRL
jgi:hypothetical protein